MSLTDDLSSSSELRNVLILSIETPPWMRDTIPKGSLNKGPLMVLNRVSETKAVWLSRMLLIGSMRTYVTKEAKATSKGTLLQTKY